MALKWNVKSDVTSRSGEFLLKRMNELGLSIGDVAERVDATYEHVRSIVRGNTLPSTLMVETLAHALRLNRVELERIATADRIRAKFGKIPFEIVGKNPEFEPLERIWNQLTEEHKGDLIAQAQAWAKRDAEKAKKH